MKPQIGTKPISQNENTCPNEKVWCKQRYGNRKFRKADKTI